MLTFFPLFMLQDMENRMPFLIRLFLARQIDSNFILKKINTKYRSGMKNKIDMKRTKKKIELFKKCTYKEEILTKV